MDADFPNERSGVCFLRIRRAGAGRVFGLRSFWRDRCLHCDRLFVQTLFVTPQLRLPFTLRQLKGQLKSLQKKNPAGQLPPNVPSWQNSSRPGPLLTSSPRPRKVPPPKDQPATKCEWRFIPMAIPDSYQSLERHGTQLTHVCPEWFSLVDGLGNLQVDADIRLAETRRE